MQQKMCVLLPPQLLPLLMCLAALLIAHVLRASWILAKLPLLSRVREHNIFCVYKGLCYSSLALRQEIQISLKIQCREWLPGMEHNSCISCTTNEVSYTFPLTGWQQMVITETARFQILFPSIFWRNCTHWPEGTGMLSIGRGGSISICLVNNSD